MGTSLLTLVWYTPGEDNPHVHGGKMLLQISIQLLLGIIPMCMGKSDFRARLKEFSRDNPHIRGEKFVQKCYQYYRKG